MTNIKYWARQDVNEIQRIHKYTKFDLAVAILEVNRITPTYEMVNIYMKMRKQRLADILHDEHFGAPIHRHTNPGGRYMKKGEVVERRGGSGGSKISLDAFWVIMGIIVLVFLFWSNVTKADRVCPKGKSYRSDLCYEVKDRSDGTRDIYPVGKSYERDETWVIDGDRMHQKGKSYKRDETWVIRR